MTDPLQPVNLERRDTALAVPEPESQANACPPPLAWRQVLDQFRDQSRTWTIERDGRVIHGRVWGEGAPLYFLNGICGSLELYALSVWLLRDVFRCVLIDYASLRSDAAVAGPGSVDDYVADLLAVADDQADDNFCIVATSFGSLVGLKAMLTQPPRIGRAVIQNGFANRTLSVFEKGLTALGCWLPGRLRHVPFRRHVQYQNHCMWFPPFDFNRFEFFLEDTGAVELAELAARVSLLPRIDFRTQLSKIRNEILLIRTEGEGRIVSGCMRELEAGLAYAESASLHTCGQLPFLTHPHRFAKLVREFCTL